MTALKIQQMIYYLLCIIHVLKTAKPFITARFLTWKFLLQKIFNAKISRFTVPFIRHTHLSLDICFIPFTILSYITPCWNFCWISLWTDWGSGRCLYSFSPSECLCEWKYVSLPPSCWLAECDIHSCHTVILHFLDPSNFLRLCHFGSMFCTKGFWV